MNNSTTQIANTAAAILLRISFGTILIAHALLKIMVFTIPGTVAYFASQGFPGWLAYPVITIELLGGAAIVLGLQTRVAAILSLPVLLGATSVHIGNGWVFNAPNGGWEFPVLLVVLAIVVALQAETSFSVSSLSRNAIDLRKQAA